MRDLLETEDIFIEPSSCAAFRGPIVLTNEEETKKYPCIFVGRCADFILREHSKLVRVFIYASPEKRIERIAKTNEVDEVEAKSLMNKIDKKRANYYNYYTSQKWGKSENYDLMIDTTKIGIEGAVELIEKYISLIS